MSEHDELVLVVPASEVDCLFRGLGDKGPSGSIARPVWLPGDGFDLGAWLSLHGEFRRRSKVEEDESQRHIATYCVIRSGAEVFTYRRGESGSEARLHARRSLGVGGHVTIGDFLGGDRLDPDDWLEGLHFAAGREVREEVVSMLATSDDIRFAGLIAGDETPVDRVHLGAVFVWETLPHDEDDEPIVPREGCLEDPAWMTRVDLRFSSSFRLESWSRIVLDHVFPPGPVGEARDR